MINKLESNARKGLTILVVKNGQFFKEIGIDVTTWAQISYIDYVNIDENNQIINEGHPNQSEIIKHLQNRI